MADNKKVFNMREALKNKNKYKGYFKSNGISTLKVTKDGVPQMVDVEIFAVDNSHPLMKEFLEKNPQPKAPIKRVFGDPKTGKSVQEMGLDSKEAARNHNFTWINVRDFANEEYEKEMQEWQEKAVFIQLIIVLGVADEYGVDDIKKFEEDMKDLGITPNQMQKLGDDIKNLDS
jgi:hypothetical protein